MTVIREELKPCCLRTASSPPTRWISRRSDRIPA
jgi:hypothetical protein